MDNTINTRIQLKIDTLSNWILPENQFILLDGEVAIAKIDIVAPENKLLQPVMMKVGDGTHTFNELDWTSAKAADVYEWAKAANKPEYLAEEIIGIVGKATQDNGEVFNDYINNSALSLNAHAEGGKVSAGGKGFKILSATDNGDGTGVYTLSSVTGLIDNNIMNYSVRLSTAKYNVGTIISINGNNITVSNYPNIALKANDVTNPETFTVENYLTIVGRPDLGDVQVGFNAHAEGEGTIAQDRDAHAEGRGSKAIGQYGHAEGRDTVAAYAAHAEGRDTIALGDKAHAEGDNSKALGEDSHAEGGFTQAIGISSHAEGWYNIAEGFGSHAEGEHSVAKGNYSHAEGWRGETEGEYSHAEGGITKAIGKYSHSEGYETIAEGGQSHAEGHTTESKGDCSHAEGLESKANGYASHAENQSIANGNYSHSEGMGTVTTAEGSHVEGKFNIIDENQEFVHIVGNGYNDGNRSNAHTLDWAGNAWFSGNVTIGPNKQKLATSDLTNIDSEIFKQKAEQAGVSGAVKSVNGKTGEVEISAEDINTYTKDEINAKISSVYKFKGTQTPFNLNNIQGVEIGDVYNMLSDGTIPSETKSYPVSVVEIADDFIYLEGEVPNARAIKDAYGVTYTIEAPYLSDIATIQIKEDNKVRVFGVVGDTSMLTPQIGQTWGLTFTFPPVEVLEGDNVARMAIGWDRLAGTVELEDLSTIATTGNIYDITNPGAVHTDTNGEKYIIFNCGTSTTVI